MIGDLTLKRRLSKKIIRIQLPDFTLPELANTAYAVMADSNIPIYLTTNYDHLLEKALITRGKDPVSEFCVWNKELEKYMKDNKILSTFNDTHRPTKSQPLVYHLHGDVDLPQSMVLTEEDYLKFLVHLQQGNDVALPSLVNRAIGDTSLLFIGYSIEDIDFRIILRNSHTKRKKQNRAVLRPTTPKNQKYLDKYMKHLFKTRIYWGQVQEFAEELRQVWDEIQFRKQSTIKKISRK